MPVISLTHSDLNEMVRRTVHSILRESVKEVQGSIMAEKEDVIQEIVDYVKDEWERIKNTKPTDEGTYTLDDKQGVRFTEHFKTYIILVPEKLTQKLGTSENFDLNVAIIDYTIPKGMEKYITMNERGTEGSSYANPKFNKFVRTSQKVFQSRVDLTIPSFNGELQVKGFYSTLYHELNHTAGRLEIQKKHQSLSDDELENLRFDTASQRKENHPHFLTQATMHPQDNSPFGLFQRLFMDEDEKKMEELKKEISFVFYAIWETTERNARAEAIYGDLKAINATRGNFRAIYPQTELCHQIEEIKKDLNDLENVHTPSKLWAYAGKVMGMKRRGKNNNLSAQAWMRYHEAIKQRFLSRSRELLDMMYRKGMKVAELYFQRKEDKERKDADKPGGGIEKLGQIIGGE